MVCEKEFFFFPIQTIVEPDGCWFDDVNSSHELHKVNILYCLLVLGSADERICCFLWVKLVPYMYFFNPNKDREHFTYTFMLSEKKMQENDSSTCCLFFSDSDKCTSYIIILLHCVIREWNDKKKESKLCTYQLYLLSLWHALLINVQQRPCTIVQI